MSVNNDGLFVPVDNNPGNAFDDPGRFNFEETMNYPFLENQSVNQTAPAAAMNGISHPEYLYEGQNSEPSQISSGNAGLGFNPSAHPQFGERPQSQMPTLDNHTNQQFAHAAYYFNQNFQPRQNRGIDRDNSLPQSSDMGMEMRPRTGRGVLPPRLPESCMRVNFNNLDIGNGDMTSYSPRSSASMEAVGIGRYGANNMSREGRMGNEFRRSPSSILPSIQYHDQNGFVSGQHSGMRPSSSAKTISIEGHNGKIFHSLAEVDAPSSGRAHGQFSILANDGGDAADGSDMSEDSISTTSSPDSAAVQRTESLVRSRATHSGIRRVSGEPMSSRQFRGPFDRVSNPIGGIQKNAGKPRGRKSKGATDPVNIEIVNWYDNHGMSFSEIAQRLNTRQEARGKPGTFTPNSIHNRYNRCAPIIYQAEGRVFVAIKDRKKHAPEELEAMSNGTHSIQWTPLKDHFLRRAVEQYEANKWPAIAASFADATKEVISAHTIATRFAFL